MKNYTSTVAAEKSIARIELALAKSGAQAINKTLANGEVSELTFTLLVDADTILNFRLPCRVEAVYKRLVALRSRNLNYKLIREQAKRTAWKILLDWVEIQLTLVELGQSKAAEVFFPYAFDGQRTIFEVIEGNKFAGLNVKALPATRPAA